MINVLDYFNQKINFHYQVRWFENMAVGKKKRAGRLGVIGGGMAKAGVGFSLGEDFINIF
jgi:hypothetical protein